LLTSLKAKRAGRPNKATKEPKNTFTAAEREAYLQDLATAVAPFYSLDLIRGWANDAAERKDYPEIAKGHRKKRAVRHTVHPATGSCDDDCPTCLRNEEVAGIYDRHTPAAGAIQREVQRLNNLEQRMTLLFKIGKRLQRDELLEKIERWWNVEHLCLNEIADKLGCEMRDAWQFITALRREGRAPRRR
jgi:hypothetical protein